MDFIFSSSLFALGLFLGMLLFLELGRRLGVSRLARTPESAKKGLGALEASIFGLMGLIVAFSFAGAAGRFDHRRELIVEENNAIGTAWLRLDLLPEAAQPDLRDLFRQYLDSRLATYAKIPDVAAAMAEYEHSQELQLRIWNAAVAACATDAGQRVAVIVLPALNQMFDICTTRAQAVKQHPPLVVSVLLFGLAFGSSLLAGYDIANLTSRSWVHILGFALVMAITVYVIADLEYPRLGFIRVDEFDAVLRELRLSMQ